MSPNRSTAITAQPTVSHPRPAPHLGGMPNGKPTPPGPEAPEAASPARRLKDVDSVERARHFFAAAWLVPWLLIVAGAVTYFLVDKGHSLLASLFIGLLFPAAGLVVYYGLLFAGIIDPGATFLGEKLYGAGSSGTPHPETYWRAQALSVRGQHREALEELELAAAEHPEDPNPCLMAAKISARELSDFDTAAAWYRKARQVAGSDDELGAYVTMRLAEVYEDAGEPGRAAVEYRRLLVLYPDSKHAQGARNGIARVKSELEGTS